jgi:hypothetical protein
LFLRLARFHLVALAQVLVTVQVQVLALRHQRLIVAS